MAMRSEAKCSSTVEQHHFEWSTEQWSREQSGFQVQTSTDQALQSGVGGGGLRSRILRKWSALSDWWTPLDGGTGTCHGHSADENLLEMSRQIDEAVHVGVVTVSGNANGEHDAAVKQPPELHQKPESSEGDREISRKKRQHDHLHLSSIDGAPQAPPCGAHMVNTGNQRSRRQRSITRSKTVPSNLPSLHCWINYWVASFLRKACLVRTQR